MGSLDYFLYLAGNPTIVLGDILIQDNVQQMISLLLNHVGSPTFSAHHSTCSSSKQSSKSLSHQTLCSQTSTIASHIGTHVSNTTNTLMVHLPTPTPLVALPSDVLPNLVCHNPLIGMEPPKRSPSSEELLHPLETTVAQTVTCSGHFPNVDIFGCQKCPNSRSLVPQITVLHGQNGLPIQTSVQDRHTIMSSLTQDHQVGLSPSFLRSTKSAPKVNNDPPWDHYETATRHLAQHFPSFMTLQ